MTLANEHGPISTFTLPEGTTTSASAPTVAVSSDRVTTWLADYLIDFGPSLRADIMRDAAAEGYGARTVDRATREWLAVTRAPRGSLGSVWAIEGDPRKYGEGPKVAAA
jgi:hypothetical protein